MMTSNQFLRTVVTVLVIGVVLATTPGCEKQDGPAERAGKAVDNAADKVGQQIEKAGDQIQDAAKGNKK